ncbi:MAG: hypothetical protein OXI38_02120 [Bacteroidota bacterium]|nr:hypothetical protein [Bacteroidota bacterium]
MPSEHSTLPGRAASARSEATENLRIIREVMERSGSFTAVPGWGMVTVGLLAVPASIAAVLQSDADLTLTIWLGLAAVAMVIGVYTLRRKMHRLGVTLRSGPGRKYVLSLLPSIVAGFVLTAALWLEGATDVLPTLWLLLYGAGTITGGASSVPAIPMLGMCFMALGVLTLLAPAAWAPYALAAGFGGLHIGFGLYIARRHDG